MLNCVDPMGRSQLKSDIMARWVETDWIPRYPGHRLLTLWTSQNTLDTDVMERYDFNFELPGGYRLKSMTQIECPVLVQIHSLDDDGRLGYKTGAYLYQFANDAGSVVDVLLLGAYFSDQYWYRVTLAALPDTFVEAWTVFTKECNRLAGALSPKNEVVIIGGRSNSFVPTVDWNDVVLPEKLKHEIQEDVQGFFSKGIEVYKRLNLKPFRKLLLAGVPGTGKTMICSALAKWALEQNFLVIYISSAVRDPNDDYGSAFGKIQHAISVAADSKYPTLILLEELDAYLHQEEKALVLNVLDGSESSMNDQGTLLIATTNYPEAIDERVLKRPGRLDRIFIVPETRSEEDAEAMLRRYLGAVWQDEHRAIVPELVGYPGAFIREVAIYALTQLAYDDLDELTLELLEKSFKGLRDQIEARDDFLDKRKSREFGYSSNGHKR
jgi:hypothetical protein